MTGDTKEILCQCATPEHTMMFHYDRREFWVDYYLYQYCGFFKRVWRALKYIFGVRQSYGHFDVTVIRPSDLQELSDFLLEAKAFIEKRERT